MSLEPNPNGVLILAEGESAGGRVSQWVVEAGEGPVLLTRDDLEVLGNDALEGIDLIVTDLDVDSPTCRHVLERLHAGALGFGIPRIHLFRSESSRVAFDEANADPAAMALLASTDAEPLVARVRLAAEIGRLRRQLSQVTILDGLTGEFNRRFLMMRLEQEFYRAYRHRTPLSLVLFDIDRLGEINERHGFRVGDRAILEVSRVMDRQVRREDVRGRWSGNTFVSLLPGTPYRGAAVFASKVRGDTEGFYIDVDGEPVPVKISAGVTSYQPDRMTEPADLIHAAEQALTEAKRRGGNRVFIDETMIRNDRHLVLIADPDPELQDLAEDLLSMDDFRVARADSVPALMETLKLRRPDVLVLDLTLGPREGVDSLVDRVHAAFPDTRIPVIGLSDADSGPTNPLEQLGVDRFITKPFSVSVLCSIVHELARRREARAASEV